MLRIPKGPTDAQLKSLLEPYKDAQLLHLSTAEGAFSRFEDREQGQRFQVSLPGNGCRMRWWDRSLAGGIVPWLGVLYPPALGTGHPANSGLLLPPASCKFFQLNTSCVNLPYSQDRVLHMAGFFCCKKVKEGEDGGVGYAQYFADAAPARRARALLRALGGPAG